MFLGRYRNLLYWTCLGMDLQEDMAGVQLLSSLQSSVFITFILV
jgi:hypothetical protein